MQLTIQVAPDDCTGCGVCVGAVPGARQERGQAQEPSTCGRSASTSTSSGPRRTPSSSCPRPTRRSGTRAPVKTSPAARAAVRVLRRLRRLRRDAVPQAAHPAVRRPPAGRQRHRLLVSIYGGNLPTTPYAVERRGPRPGVVQLACSRTTPSSASASASAYEAPAAAPRVDAAATELEPQARPGARRPRSLGGPRRRRRRRHPGAARAASADAHRRLRSRWTTTRRRGGCSTSPARWSASSVWIVGGDGWAYDIGSGGLDHVLGSGRNVNVLVLDTEVYSNTGGQASKATPRGAVAKFASAGKGLLKKDLGLEAMSLRRRLRRPDRAGRQRGADGEGAAARPRRGPAPSLVIAYSTCIAHGFDMAESMEPAEAGRAQRALAAVPLPARRRRRRPTRSSSTAQGADACPTATSRAAEARFAMLARSNPERAKRAARAGPGRRRRALAATTSSWPAWSARRPSLTRATRREPIARRRGGRAMTST